MTAPEYQLLTPHVITSLLPEAAWIAGGLIGLLAASLFLTARHATATLDRAVITAGMYLRWISSVLLMIGPVVAWSDVPLEVAVLIAPAVELLGIATLWAAPEVGEAAYAARSGKRNSKLKLPLPWPVDQDAEADLATFKQPVIRNVVNLKVDPIELEEVAYLAWLEAPRAKKRDYRMNLERRERMEQAGPQANQARPHRRVAVPKRVQTPNGPAEHAAHPPDLDPD